MKRSRLLFGYIVVLILITVALFAPWIATRDPTDQDLAHIFASPNWVAGDDRALLGGDSLGRDVFSRLIYGTRATLLVAVLGAGLAGILGTLLGLLAGYRGGWIDVVVSKSVDVWMSFPAMLLSIVLASALGAGLHTVVIALGVIDWTRFCRVVRAEVQVQRAQDYVAAAVSIGLTPWQIVRTELLPNVAPLLITLFTLEMGIAIVVEAILAFAGLSATRIPTWGGVLQEGRLYVNQAWWLLAAPTLCIVVAVLGLNALGDGLRDRFDPVRR